MSLATGAISGNVASNSTKGLWPARSRNVPATILELVWIVSELTANDDEVVATVSHMIRSGTVQLRTHAGD